MTTLVICTTFHTVQSQFQIRDRIGIGIYICVNVNKPLNCGVHTQVVVSVGGGGVGGLRVRSKEQFRSARYCA